MWPHHHTKMVGVCGRLITLRGGFVWPYHYTKRGGFCGSIITVREEVCVAVSLH